MDAKLIAKLHLCSNATPTKKNEKLASQHSTENGEKVSALLRSAVAIFAYHFPMMKQEAWAALLTLVQPRPFEPSSPTIQQLLPCCNLAFYLAEIVRNYSEIDQETLGISRIAQLSPAEMFSVGLVSDHFWGASEIEKSDLRAILSLISGRPEECVFSDDPSPEELWEVTDINISDRSSGMATFTYAGAPMASLAFKLLSDPTEVIGGALECEENRSLVLPGQNMRSMLFNITLPKVFETLAINERH